MRLTTFNATRGRPSAAAALLPIPARSPAASSAGVVQVSGRPGTMPIPAPRPAALPPISATRATQPSWCAPNVILPDLYVTTPAGMHPPVMLQRTNELPVPAVGVYSAPGIAQRSRRVGGQSQVGQPQVLQTWPQWRGQAG